MCQQETGTNLKSLAPKKLYIHRIILRKQVITTKIDVSVTLILKCKGYNRYDICLYSFNTNHRRQITKKGILSRIDLQKSYIYESAFQLHLRTHRYKNRQNRY